MKVNNGSTNHPESRSKMTEEKPAGRLSVSAARRATRRTSPPMLVGITLETNCPAM